MFIQAREMHRVVDEQRIQLLEAVTELQRNLQMQASDAGVMHGMVDTISRSIARTDETLTAVGSFADAQVLHIQ
jgi:hypothetical protein